MAHPKSGKDKHSFVQFYPSDWLGGTSRMTRLIRSVFFDICLYTWDKVEPVPEAEQMLMFDDLGPQGEQIINVLVSAGKLIRNADGSIYNDRALAEAQRAYDLWQRKSGGGKRGAARTNGGGTPDEGGGDSRQGLSAQNQNQNQNQSDSGGKPPLGDGGQPAGESEPAPRKTYDVMKIAEAWNVMAAAHGLAQVKKMTEERRKKTRARLDEYTEEEVLEAISKVPERPFLMGENQRRWKADYDFLVRPNSVTKILEGGAYKGSGSGWLDGD